MIRSSWPVFLVKLLPVAKELIEILYERHSGNVAAAAKDLRRVPDNWRDMDEREARVDERIAAVAEREQAEQHERDDKPGNV